jgi:hypothetical protein
MNYIIDGWNNFCRVFMLPNEYSPNFCFDGGIDTNFKMMDWFSPFPGLPIPTIGKIEWVKEFGKIDQIELPYDAIYRQIVPFVNSKIYMIKDRQYLIIFDFELSIMFTATKTGGDT